jgi:hypothetical protein
VINPYSVMLAMDLFSCRIIARQLLAKLRPKYSGTQLNAISKWLTTLGVLALTFGPTAQSAQPVLQRGYDADVSGANLAETTLNTSNVGPNTFGLVFKLPLDDAVYAQPLYVPNVAILNQGTHNVVYVATMSDTLYAFDADAGGAPLWSVNFASLVGAMPVPIANFVFSGNMNIVGNLGILSTPVIDPSTNVLYLVACTLENNTLAYRLHAVDITTGAEPYGPGVLITGSYGSATFVARYQTQRVSLVLSGNQVVFGFGPVESEYPNGYTGWVMAYNRLTLQQSGIFATEATGNGGAGVWQSGRPPAVDSSGYVYVFAGNAFGDGYDGVNNFSESALKLDPANGLTLIDWFTPGSWSTLDAQDLDTSGSGPMLIPGTSLLAGGGKAGDLYVLNTADLGKYNATDSQIVQEENITDGGEIHGGPVYWQRSAANGGPLLYNWGELDPLKAYAFNGTTFAANPSTQGSGSQIWPGGILALSANGEQAGSGVLWATVATSGDAQDDPSVPGELHAFDAGNISQELWNSTTNASRDGFGNFAKFVPPLVANGKVYVATRSNQLAVYGLVLTYKVSPTSLAFGSEMTNVASAPLSVTVTNTGAVSLPITNITLSTPSPFSQTNTCGTSVAVGASCTVSVVFNPTSVGSATTTLSLNAGGTTSTVNLSGYGSFKVVLTASSNSVTLGVPVTLKWSSTPGATCTTSGGINGDNWTGKLAAGGSQSVSEAATGNYNYVLNCIAQGVSATATVTVAVTLPTVTLSAAPTSITVGQSVTLTWASENAVTCVASGGQSSDGWANTRSTNGTATVTPNAAGTITYTMTCSSGPKSAQSIAQVIASSPPSSTGGGGGGGGGAFDAISLLSLLAMIGLRQRRRLGTASLRKPVGFLGGVDPLEHGVAVREAPEARDGVAMLDGRLERFVEGRAQLARCLVVQPAKRGH